MRAGHASIKRAVIAGWGAFPILATAGVLCAAAALAAEAPAVAPPGPDRSHHLVIPETRPAIIRSAANYQIPEVQLVRADGARVTLARELDDQRPILLDFIYTTCSAICPVLSQTFAEVQKRLGNRAGTVKMMSISIDPEEDTPARLTEFSRGLGAQAQWQFYTGTVDASIAAQRAFENYRGDKMNHAAITYYRPAPGQPWVRLEGFATPDDLMREILPLQARD